MSTGGTVEELAPGGEFRPVPGLNPKPIVYKKVLMGEIFGGTCVLTAAVRAAGGKTLKPWDLFDPSKMVQQAEFNLLEREGEKRLADLIKEGTLKWLHFAPPCKSFSRARRSQFVNLFF